MVKAKQYDYYLQTFSALNMPWKRYDTSPSVHFIQTSQRHPRKFTFARFRLPHRQHYNEDMMNRVRTKAAAHGLLFVLAFVVFYVGLGVGLQYNPTIGTLLWVAAAAIVALNLFWIIRSRR